MSRPRISVAMSTYNGADFLMEQLESILNQSIGVDEIVISDDCSGDATPQIASLFSNKHPGLVRFSRNDENVGYAKNFGIALSRCSGDIIFLSDQDDVWLPTKVEKVAAVFAEREDVGLVGSAAVVTDRQLEGTGQILFPFEANSPRRGDTFSARYQRSFAYGCTLALRASLRSLILPIPGCWAHDNWICFIAPLVSGVHSIQEPLMLYRRHPCSAGLNEKLDFGLWKQVMIAARRNSRTDYQRDREQWEAAYGHLMGLFDSDRGSVTFGRGNPSGACVLEQVRSRVNFSLRRLKAIEMSRPLRVLPVLRLLLAGQYHEFGSGWKSLAKDLLTQ